MSFVNGISLYCNKSKYNKAVKTNSKWSQSVMDHYCPDSGEQLLSEGHCHQSPSRLESALERAAVPIAAVFVV